MIVIFNSWNGEYQFQDEKELVSSTQSPYCNGQGQFA